MIDDEVKNFIAGLDVLLQEIVINLHNALLKIDPEYEVKIAWGGLGYKKGKDYSCHIAPYRNHIKLMIWNAAKFDDPKRKLEGIGNNTRYIKFTSISDIDPSYLKFLLDQQKAFT